MAIQIGRLIPPNCATKQIHPQLVGVLFIRVLFSWHSLEESFTSPNSPPDEKIKQMVSFNSQDGGFIYFYLFIYFFFSTPTGRISQVGCVAALQRFVIIVSRNFAYAKDEQTKECECVCVHLCSVYVCFVHEFNKKIYIQNCVMNAEGNRTGGKL